MHLVAKFVADCRSYERKFDFAPDAELAIGNDRVVGAGQWSLGLGFDGLLQKAGPSPGLIHGPG
jgi:hypothetical protein